MDTPTRARARRRRAPGRGLTGRLNRPRGGCRPAGIWYLVSMVSIWYLVSGIAGPNSDSGVVNPGVTFYENGVERWNRACNSQNARGYCGCGACNFCAHFWEGAAGGSREPCRTTTALPLLRGGGGGTRRRCCGPPDGPPRALPAPPP